MEVNDKDQSWFSTVIFYLMLKAVIYDGPLERSNIFFNSSISFMAFTFPGFHDTVWFAILMCTSPFFGTISPRWALSLVLVGPAWAGILVFPSTREKEALHFGQPEASGNCWIILIMIKHVYIKVQENTTENTCKWRGHFYRILLVGQPQPGPPPWWAPLPTSPWTLASPASPGPRPRVACSSSAPCPHLWSLASCPWSCPGLPSSQFPCLSTLAWPWVLLWHWLVSDTLTGRLQL